MVRTGGRVVGFFSEADITFMGDLIHCVQGGLAGHRVFAWWLDIRFLAAFPTALQAFLNQKTDTLALLNNATHNFNDEHHHKQNEY